MNDYTAIADLYDAYVTDTRDYAFWSRFADRAAGPILELTAGTGRATVALRRPGGPPVVALDLAQEMLARLVVRFRGAERPALAVCGDATRLPFRPEHFALVAIPFTSFGELIEPAERAAALRELRRVLAPTGRVVIPLHDPGRRRQTLDGLVRPLGPFLAGDIRLEVLVRGRLLDPDVAESEQTYRVFRGGQLLEERQIGLRFALPDAESLLRMAADAGLAPDAVFGDYDESPYAPGSSPLMIAVLRRA